MNLKYLLFILLILFSLISHTLSFSAIAQEKCGLNTFRQGLSCEQEGTYQNAKVACHGKSLVELNVGECLSNRNFKMMAKDYCQRYCDGDYINLEEGESHFLMQISENYYEFRLEKMHQINLRFHESYNDSWHLVSLDDQRHYDQVLAYAAARTLRVKSSSKLSQSLKEGSFSPYARRPNFKTRLTVEFYNDVRIEDAIFSIEELGLETVDNNFLFGHRLRIDIPLDRNILNLISQLESVKSIYQKDWEIISDNQNASVFSGISLLNTPPYNLSGEGVSVAVWDEGIASVNHPDFQDRLSLGDFAAGELSSHATSIAGTIGANPDPNRDDSDLTARGMAPSVRLFSYNAQTIERDPFHEKHLSYLDLEKNIKLDNNSFSEDLSIGSRDFASYKNQSAQWDRLVANHPEVVIVKSAGNFRDDISEEGERNGFLVNEDYYGNIAPLAISKNIITVGAVDENNQSLNSSSFGPAKDGRIKPDLVALGTSLRSLSRAGAYRDTREGTSNSAAIVSGGIALLQEQYKNLNNGSYPQASLIKALLIQTAVDFDAIPGPNYKTGYGKVDFNAAADLIQRRDGSYYLNSSIDSREKHYYGFNINEDAIENIKLSLAWTDWPGSPNQNLLNDIRNKIKIRLISPNRQVTYAWSLDRSNPDQPATQNRPNEIDNAQQIFIENPGLGLWIVEVEGKNIFEGGLILENGDEYDQFYSLVSSHSLSLLEEDDLNRDDPDNHQDDNVDDDGDGILDLIDNCPDIANQNQSDVDGDGLGDLCDNTIDLDGDGVADGEDNCLNIANEGQEDQDNDGVGDHCDDDDGDQLFDNEDNCPDVLNPDQLDSDGDQIGDLCDLCPMVPNPFQSEQSEEEGAVTCSQIVAMNSNVCFLSAQGEVSCWGNGGEHSSLGVGGRFNSNVPALINHFPEAAEEELRFTQMARGVIADCAVDLDRKIWCWGMRADDSPTLLNHQTDMMNEELEFLQVSVGLKICALDSNRKVWCWADNEEDMPPVRINHDPLNSGRELVFNQISVERTSGRYFACAIDSNRKIWCWDESEIPFRVNHGEEDEISFSWFLGHSGSNMCAFDTNSNVRCWSRNGDHLDNLVNFYFDIDVINNHPNLSFKQISITGSNSCGINADQKIWCWGENRYGELGNDTLRDSVFPVRVNHDPLDSGEELSFKAIGLGYSTSCAIDTDDQLWCWGRDNDGSLGNRDLGSSSRPSLVGVPDNENPEDYLRDCDPQQEVCSPMFNQISTGLHHTCAIGSNNKIWCWGDNYYGQLGTGNFESSNIPVPIISNPEGEELSFRSVSSGVYYTCAIDFDFQAWCWGNNENGQVGNTDIVEAANNILYYSTTATPVRVSQGELEFNSISAGSDHTCALDLQQQVWCWGLNVDDQLGISSEQNRILTWPSVMADFGDEDVRFGSIHSFYDITCGVSIDNELWCWGDFFDGNTRISLRDPENLEEEILIEKMTMGEVRNGGTPRMPFCVVDLDSKAWCGSNIINLFDFNRIDRSVHNRMDPDLSILDLASVFGRTCVLDSNQEIWCWGVDANGNMGTGVLESLLTTWPPRQIEHYVHGPNEEPLRFTSIDMEEDHTCAITTNNEAWCWGYDGQGQLGNLDYRTQTIPSKVYMSR